MTHFVEFPLEDGGSILVEVTGTHTEELSFPDGSSLPPTGNPIRVELAEFWRFEGDKIAEAALKELIRAAAAANEKKSRPASKK